MKELKLSMTFAREMRKDHRAYISELIVEHGPAFALKGPKFDLHILSGPKYFHHVLNDNSANYIYPANAVIHKVLGKSETLKSKIDGEKEWTKERINTIESLIGPEVINAKKALLIENCTKIIDGWKTKIGTQIAVRPEIMEISTRNLCDVFFGGVNDISPLFLLHSVQEFFYLIGQYEGSLTKLPWLLPTPMYFRTKKLINSLRTLTKHLVTECLSPEKTDNNVIREIAKNYLPNYPNLNENDINLLMQRATVLLFGGSENVPTFLTHALGFLSRHPYAAERVYKEVDEILGDRMMKPEDIDKLKYMRAFLSESLRFSVGSFIPRCAIEDDEVAGYKIKKLDRILVPVCYIHKNPEYWDNPESFNPERFMKPLPHDFYHYIPFGYGPRNCLAGYFGMIEMMTILPTMLQRYRLDLGPNITVDPDLQRQDPASRLVMMNLRAK